MSTLPDAPAPRSTTAGATRSAIRRRAPRLADVADGRDNNVLAIRHLAAAAVILFHSYALTDRWSEEPLWAHAAPINLAIVGVGAFFVLSGVLVTQSWIARPTLRAFLPARVLRIYPALVAATAVTILLAGASVDVTWREWLSSADTWRYLLRTATAVGGIETLPGAFAANPFPNAVNGSLWTLPVEVRLYLVVAFAGLAGLLVRPRAWLAAAAALVALALGWPEGVPLDPNTEGARLAAFLFLLGSLACAWRHRLPLSLPVAAALLAAIAVDAGGAMRGGPGFALALAYLVLVAGWHPALRLSRLARAPDWSYGLYVYAFPIQQAIVRLDTGIAPLSLFAFSMVTTLVAAGLSWRFLEAPALRLKSRFRPREPDRP